MRKCSAPGCQTQTPEFMCPEDWRRVSATVRKAFNQERQYLVAKGQLKLSELAKQLVAAAVLEASSSRKAQGLPHKNETP